MNSEHSTLSFCSISVLIITMSSAFGLIIVSTMKPLYSLAQGNLTNPTISQSLQGFNSLPQLYKRVYNSVVTVSVDNTTMDVLNGLGSGISGGSGFIYDTAGHIVTNAHVAVNGINGSIFVTFSNGDSYPVKIAGIDTYTDLAVLQLDPSVLSKEMAIPLRLGNSSALEVGQQVVSIGNPLQAYRGTMNAGIISQVNRVVPFVGNGKFLLPGVIQTDAAIAHGSSGGPLLNLAGEVVGVTSYSEVSPVAPGIPIEIPVPGIYFAVPSDTVRKVAPELILHGEYKHPWTGIYGANVNPEVAKALGLKEANGVLVLGATPGSPADLAGISIFPPPHSQVIVGIDNKRVKTLSDVLIYVDSKSVGDTITLRVLKDGSIRNIPLTLLERPSAPLG